MEKNKEDKFIENAIKTLEEQHIKNIKDEFAIIIALGIWDVSSVKTEDGYVRKENMGRIL